MSGAGAATGADEREWVTQEAEMQRVNQEGVVMSHLVNVLEAVAGREWQMAGGGDVPVPGGRVWTLMQDSFRYCPSPTRPPAGMRQKYQEMFKRYDQLGVCLGVCARVLSRHVDRQMRSGLDVDQWLMLFCVIMDKFMYEMCMYRDSLVTLTQGGVEQVGMCAELFKVLVGLFLTADQIARLKLTVDRNTHTILDNMASAIAMDTNNIRKHVRAELIGDSDMLLMTTVYMLHVDITAAWGSMDFRSLPFYNGDSRKLLLFAEAEIKNVETRVQEMGGAWQAFLRTVRDASGQPLQECSICDRRIRDVIYKPCGHFVACSVCAAEWAARVSTCPICRQEVAETDSVRKHLNEKAGTRVVREFEWNGKAVPITLSAHVAGGDVRSLLTQLSLC